MGRWLEWVGRRETQPGFEPGQEIRWKREGAKILENELGQMVLEQRRMCTTSLARAFLNGL